MLTEVRTNEIILTRKDILQFNYKTLYGNFGFLLFSFIGIGNLVIMIAGIVKEGPHIISEYNFFNYFMVGLTIFIPFLIYRSADRASRNKFVSEPKVYTFSIQGIRYVTPSTTMQMKWEDIVRVKRYKGLLQLFVAANSAHLIPLNSIQTENGYEQIETWIREFVPVKARKPKKNLLRGLVIYMLIFLVTVGVVKFISTQ